MLTEIRYYFFQLSSDQAEAHRQKAKAARERRVARVTAKKESTLAEYSAKADKTSTVVAKPAKEDKKAEPVSEKKSEKKKSKK